MSVLINGMAMPKSCLLCPFGDEFGKCCVNVELEDAKELTHSCPLVTIPNHGDLIDREYAVGSACSGRIRALPTTEDGEDWIRVEEVRQSLKSVPAVIPAERSEDETD